MIGRAAPHGVYLAVEVFVAYRTLSFQPQIFCIRVMDLPPGRHALKSNMLEIGLTLESRRAIKRPSGDKPGSAFKKRTDVTSSLWTLRGLIVEAES